MPSARALAVTEHLPDGPGRDGPLVVLVHGSLDRAGSFARVLRRLEDLHTLAYDRRGYERSRDALPLHDSLDGHIDDLVAVIDRRPAAVIGHSYGGVVALGAALRERGGGSILGVGAYEPPLPWLGFSRVRPAAAAVRSEEEDPAIAAERFFRRMVGDAAWERLPEDVKRARHADGPALVAELRAIRIDGPPFDVTALAVPAVFARGSASLPHHRAAVAWLVEHVRDAELVEITGARHGAHLTHPDAFAGFVARHARAGDRRCGDSGMKVLVTGSSGLIGTALVERLMADGHSIVRMVRGSAPDGGGPPGDTPEHGTVRWDPAGGSLDADALAAAGPFGAVVHLAGAGLGDKRWSSSRKREILDSRTDSTRLIGTALAALDAPPSVLVSASAVGVYGDRGDEVLTERSAPGDGFLAEVCRAWEQAASPAADAGIRTVLLRSGIVLSARGGALARQLPLFRLGLGGKLGRGRQYRSWITLDDEIRVILRCIEDAALVGPVNATAPEPATDAQFARALGVALGRPAVLAVPSPALRLLLGPEMAAELLLSGQRVHPEALGSRGFGFSHPHLGEALRWAVQDR